MEDSMVVGPNASCFKELDADLQACKVCVESALSRKFSRRGECSRYFLEVLVSTTRLYLDSLVFARALKESSPDETEANDSDLRPIKHRKPTRELAFREKFSRKVESLPCWRAFNPINSFVEENQLRNRSNYLFNLTLHLPEIYGEVVDLREVVRRRLKAGCLSEPERWKLVAGLEHVAHHASYCRHTLEVLSNELSWR